MKASRLTGITAEAFRNAGAFVHDILRPTVRLGVTGLSRAGKTVFITSLVHNLIAGGRLPFFDPVAQGRLRRAYLEPQPDDDIPRFDYEHHLAELTTSPPRWPQSTRRLSQLRLTLEFEPRNYLDRALRRDTLHIDIVDYPGEWLLDLPLLNLSYNEWSSQALAMSREETRKGLAKGWHALIASLDPAGDESEEAASRALGGPHQVNPEARRSGRGSLRAHRASGIFLAGRWPHHTSHDGFKRVVAGVMQMVRFCCGKQYLADAAIKDAGEPAVGSGPEAFEDIAQSAFKIEQGRRAAIEGFKGVDEYDLPVETRKMIPEEGFYHMGFISLIPAFHHGPQRAALWVGLIR